ncbi:lantibiotic immunity ABC transporter MutE/EpiE family permease subunit [Candidatus Enterococcus murrayae]|uniref:Lantibiotic immunity ABC transporter MutE/EpiE family permease subunit n=1 Tax=Candidatus Enterococcus murrayae TaxID=2815321 RepID=A0ABS3HHU0_9ENTE|nr:lantibiotic immunity ABC transporter MutE/EpiE family permease subunit [Enterococcus sp. MJM16]MBO0453025.1 lantibiotic immunity ABC transporter MutE/EpiE family permease subunit [Enterococcus sp. MJM16]
MGKIIQAELLKGKRSFGRKGIVLFPLLVSLMAIFLMGGQFTQIGAYNWWYMLLLPMVAALICNNLIDSDKQLSFFNVNILPISAKKIWQGKIWTGVLYLVFGNGLVFGLTTFSGLLFPAQYPVWRGAAAGIVLTVCWLWQIPFGLFLANRFNSIVTFLSILFLNIFCSSQTFAGGNLWYLPFAIAPRLMAPIIGINPNGVPLAAGSPLYDTSVIVPGLIITVSLFVLGYCLTTKWFGSGGHYHEKV